ncbi:MAG: diacylglycerol kinase family protein [Frankiaceae bacterium]
MTAGGVTVIFNPNGSVTELAVRGALGLAGLRRLRWLETTAEDPGTGQARAAVAGKADLVVVCGGDGTVMAVVSVLAGSGIPLAVLPGGTGNLLARNYGIPLQIVAAARLTTLGRRRHIDVGVLGEERFAVMAGIGFDAAFLDNAPPGLKRWLGWAAYVVSGIRTLRRSPLAAFELRLDGATEPMRRRGRGVLVANVGRLQGGLEMLPAAVGDDGLFEIGLLAPRRLRDWWGLVWRVVVKRHPHLCQLETWSAARVEISVDRKLPVELDGDVRAEQDLLVAQVDPAALVLCVPADG